MQYLALFHSLEGDDPTTAVTLVGVFEGEGEAMDACAENEEGQTASGELEWREEQTERSNPSPGSSDTIKVGQNPMEPYTAYTVRPL